VGPKVITNIAEEYYPKTGLHNSTAFNMLHPQPRKAVTGGMILDSPATTVTRDRILKPEQKAEKSAQYLEVYS